MTVDVFSRFEDARADWAELDRQATISPYQSYAFLSAWAETVGKTRRVRPFLVVARDDDGRPDALLPLCIETRAGARIGCYFGGRESNFNLPLLRPGAGYDEPRLRRLLVEAARRAPTPPDLLYLRNQPRRFEGVDNPLAFRCARPSASFAYGTTLPAKAEALAERLSKDSRKKLRKKEARLAESGALQYEHQPAPERRAEIIDTLIRQKTERFAELGIGDAFSRSGLSDLLTKLSSGTESGAIELHALSIGGRIVATYAGVVRGGRFSAMLNSFDMDEEIARSSPGDLLLHSLMRNLVERGLTHFDLGAGEARYKNAVCDETIELCDLILPVSPKGHVTGPLLSAFLQAKRRVKQTPALANAVYRARRLMADAS